MYMSANMASQKGIALIAVLLILILIMILGAMAVRQSRVDLAVATTDQVNALTLNAADSSLAYIEQVVGDRTSSQRAHAMSQAGIFGYFLVQGQARVGHQVASCYKPGNAQFFSRKQNGRTLLPGGGKQGNDAAICDPSQASNYISGRNTAMNQIVVVSKEGALSDNFKDAELGVSNRDNTLQFNPYVQVNSVAVLPGMAKVSSNAIKSCLEKPIGDATAYKQSVNMNDCLRKEAIPHRTLVEEGRLTKKVTGGYTDSADGGTGIGGCQSAACKAASGL